MDITFIFTGADLGKNPRGAEGARKNSMVIPLLHIKTKPCANTYDHMFCNADFLKRIDPQLNLIYTVDDLDFHEK